MAVTNQIPLFRVFSPDNKCIAGFDYAEDALNFAQENGFGSEVRYGFTKNRVVWRVSAEDDSIGDGEIINTKLLWERCNALDAEWGYSYGEIIRVKPYTYTPRERKATDE